MPSETKFDPKKGILLGGLLCGFLDISAAITFYGILRGNSPIAILQSVATGLLGRESYSGGIPTAFLGLLLHFTIAFIWATVFYIASRKLKFLIQHPILTGVLYGIFVFFFMQLVVVPLSAFPHSTSFTARGLFTGLTIHIFCVGLPIVLSIYKYSKETPPIHDLVLELEP